MNHIFATDAALEHADYLDRLASQCETDGSDGHAEDHRRSAELIRWLVLGNPYGGDA